MPTTTELLELIKSRTTVRPSGCWTWHGSTNGQGYGEIRIEQKKHYVHRLAYEITIGEIPEGLVIDHLCGNPSCCNPEHLEPVRQGENIRRGGSREALTAMQAKITRCPQGHPYDEANTYRPPAQPNHRMCRECSRARARAWRAARANNH